MTNKTEKKGKTLLPEIDHTQFLADPTVWAEIKEETERLIPLIDKQGEELSPEEFENVKQLAKTVRDHVSKYRKTVTKQATTYKERVEKELDAIDYGKIENYMAERRKQHQKEISDRLNNQLSKFNQLVADALSNTNYVKSSRLASQVSNLLMKRFPNVNSGAKSKQIKKWGPVESVINATIAKVDDIMTKQPIIQELPAHSKTLRELSVYLEQGNENALEQVTTWLEEDRAIIQRLVLKKRVESAEDTANEMRAVLSDESINADTMIERVRILLSVYDNQTI